MFAAIIGLGFSQGAEALPVVIWLTIAARTSDVLDGAFARHSRVQRRTWIGEQDLIFDMVIGAALLVYLAAAGFMNIWLAGAYLGFSVLVFWRFGLTPALVSSFRHRRTPGSSSSHYAMHRSLDYGWLPGS